MSISEISLLKFESSLSTFFSYPSRYHKYQSYPLFHNAIIAVTSFPAFFKSSLTTSSAPASSLFATLPDFVSDLVSKPKTQSFSFLFFPAAPHSYHKFLPEIAYSNPPQNSFSL